MQLDDLRLDMPTLDDVPAIFDIYSDPRVWTHLPSGRHTERERTEVMVQAWIDGWERDGLSSWIVRDADSGVVLGNAGCWVKRDVFWNLGYRLAYDAQGRGIASRVSGHAVKEARVVRPELPVVAILLEHNKASARVAEKVGLTVQHRGPDAGNPDPEAIRLVAADRPLSESQVHAASS
ncbi:GNAT family N-acetyltransferase [Nesterenkonia alba]|uniref:GNAT family N-acetyltransferase n=1 Tax=Nesterenkonia alba TaxID=515814 RepID=UPI000407468D|nr:GNAT family N-acetyltransferase [Nesterenkonia alba]